MASVPSVKYEIQVPASLAFGGDQVFHFHLDLDRTLGRLEPPKPFRYTGYVGVYRKGRHSQLKGQYATCRLGTDAG